MTLSESIIGGSIGARGDLKFNAKYQIKLEGLGNSFGNIKIVRRSEKETILSNDKSKIEKLNNDYY